MTVCDARCAIGMTGLGNERSNGGKRGESGEKADDKNDTNVRKKKLVA